MGQRRVLLRLGSAALTLCLLQVAAVSYEPSMKHFLDLYNNTQGEKLRLLDLKYQRCGPESDPARLNKLEITSTSKGDAVVSLSATTDVELRSPIEVSIEIHKHMFGGWVRIPCISDNIGSCVHDDFCQYGFEECPFESLRRAKVPCHCPVAKGTYALNQVEVPVPLIPNAGLVVGDYKFRVIVRKGETKQQLACYNGTATLEVFH